MTLDDLLALSRVVAERYAIDKDVPLLARGILDLLGTGFPCGWPAITANKFAACVDSETFGSIEPDEARGIGVALIRCADEAEAG